MKRKGWIALMLLGILGGGCQPRPLPPADAASPTPAEVLPLPQPRTTGETSLEETLARRRSIREFTSEPLTWTQLSQLLWAAQGVTNPAGFRTAPSAGALYPLAVYVATVEGVYRYQPQGHRAIRLSEADVRPRLCKAALEQGAVCQAPAVLVITAIFERTSVKYGARSERYVKLEAGHAGQNILSQAVALGLGAVPIGAFHDDQVQAALGLLVKEIPLYIIPVGHPRSP